MLKEIKLSSTVKSRASTNPLPNTGILWSGVQINSLPLSKVNLITSVFFLVTPAQLITPGTISPVSGLQLYAQFSLPAENSAISSDNSRVLPSSNGMRVDKSKHNGLYEASTTLWLPPVTLGIRR